MSEAEFVELHPYSCLVITQEQLPTEESDKPDFHTAGMAFGSASANENNSFLESLLMRITKAPGNPWSERVSIGRARNNDLVLRSQSVSKLHGHFLHRDDGVYFADVGSKNGSSLNGVPLQKSEHSQLTTGDTLVIGRVGSVFRSPAGLYRSLSETAS